MPQVTSQSLSRENLGGVWAAIATPWDESNRFDEGTLRENVRRLAAAGVDGIYTTDKDGEFFAIELQEFRQVVAAFADEARAVGISTQVGVTWLNTAGVVDRLDVAVRNGIQGAHIGHPPFMELTAESLDAFWVDVAASVPADFGLVHYNSPRLSNRLGPADYARLSTRHAGLIGTKQTTTDFAEFLAIVNGAPDLAHFAGEQALVPFVMAGAKGIYSWLANFNAPYTVQWFNECRTGKWEAAIHRQKRVGQFSGLIEAVFGAQVRRGIVSKSVAAASSFLVGNDRTRRPYLPAGESAIAEFRRRVLIDFPDLLEGLEM